MKLIDVSSFDEINSLNYQMSSIELNQDTEFDVVMYAQMSRDRKYHKFDVFNGFFKSVVRLIDEKGL